MVDHLQLHLCGISPAKGSLASVVRVPRPFRAEILQAGRSNRTLAALTVQNGTEQGFALVDVAPLSGYQSDNVKCNELNRMAFRHSANPVSVLCANGNGLLAVAHGTQVDIWNVEDMLASEQQGAQYSVACSSVITAFVWSIVSETTVCEAAVVFRNRTAAVVVGGKVKALGVGNVTSLAWGKGPAPLHSTTRIVIALGRSDGGIVLKRPMSSNTLANIGAPSNLSGPHSVSHLRALGNDLWLVGFTHHSMGVFYLLHITLERTGYAWRWRELGPLCFPNRETQESARLFSCHLETNHGAVVCVASSVSSSIEVLSLQRYLFLGCKLCLNLRVTTAEILIRLRLGATVQ